MKHITVMQTERSKIPQKSGDGLLSYSWESLSDLDELFDTATKGTKSGGGFVRGLLKGQRYDKNIDSSSLIIIDADSGINGNPCPEPRDSHKALVKLGYNHILYTSHSHTKEVNKYRILIETATVMSKPQLKPTVSSIMQELLANGIGIKHVKEMNSFSQHWHWPRRDNPADRLFEHYSYFDGVALPVSREETKEEIEAPSPGNETLDELYENIRTGAEYHESMNNIIYQLTKDGVSPAHVRAQLTTLFNSSNDAGSERWLERFRDIERSVKGAQNRAESLTKELPEYGMSTKKDCPPFPYPDDGGILDRTIKQVHDNMSAPNMMLAYIQTMAVYATAIGAAVNYIGDNGRLSACNISFIIVAESGIGKSSLTDFANYVFRSGMNGAIPAACSILNMDTSIYLGAGDYSGPVPLHREIRTCRNLLCIDTEFGQSRKTKAGEPGKLMKYQLNAAVDSDNNSVVLIAGRTKVEDFTDPVTGANLNRISESNPTTAAEVLKDASAYDSGEANRNTFFKIEGSPKVSGKRRRSKEAFDLDDDIRDKVFDLMRASWAVHDGSVHKFDYKLVELNDEDFADYGNIFNSLAEDYDDHKERIMARRIAHKMIKFAVIKTCVDRKLDEDYEKITVIRSEDWAWAKSAALYEMESMGYHMSFLDDENAYEALDNEILGVIGAGIRHKDTTDKQREQGVVKWSVFKDRMTNRLLTLAKHSFKSPDQFVLERLIVMSNLGYVSLKDGHVTVRGKIKCIVLTDSGVDQMERLLRHSNQVEQ